MSERQGLSSRGLTLLKVLVLLLLLTTMGIHVASLATRHWWNLDYPSVYNDDSGIEDIHGGLWLVCTSYLRDFERPTLCRNYDSRIAFLAQIPPMQDWMVNVRASRTLGIMSCSLFLVSGLLVAITLFIKRWRKLFLWIAAFVMSLQGIFQVVAIGVIHHWLRADLNLIDYSSSFICACAVGVGYFLLMLLTGFTARAEKSDKPTDGESMEMGEYTRRIAHI